MVRNLVKLQGFDIDTFTMEEAIEYAFNNSPQIVTINPEIISSAKNNPALADIIHNSGLVVPDGVGIQIGLKILGSSVERVPGVDLGKALLKKYADSGKRIALIGAKPQIIKLAMQNLKNEIQNVNIVYSHDGYFNDEEVILNELVSSSPDLVLIALGSPKQEFFGLAIKKRLINTTVIGLGGSFDVWSGVVERAPEVYQKLGLEWLYRTLKQPERFRRIFPTLPIFVLNVIKERFTN